MSLRLVLVLVVLGLAQVNPQKAKIYQDLNDTVAGPWIYDDLASGYATARKSGKPMLVVFR